MPRRGRPRPHPARRPERRRCRVPGCPEGRRLMAAQRLHVADGPEDVRVAVEQPGGVAQRVLADVAALDDEGLVLAARELAGTISTAEAHLAALVAEIERRRIHERWECTTIGRYASWHLQLAPQRAHRLAHLGTNMSRLPAMAEAVCDGTLSVDKAQAVARAAGPSTEKALVDLAVQSTTAQTQRLCGRWRRHQEANPDLRDDPVDHAPSDQHPDRGYRPTVIVDHDDDGVTIRARFDHVDGAYVLTALDRSTHEVRAERRDAVPVAGVPTEGRPADPSEVPLERLTPAQWRAEGLLRMARHTTDIEPRRGLPNGFDTQAVLHIGVDDVLDPVDQRPDAADPAHHRPDMSHALHPPSSPPPTPSAEGGPGLEGASPTPGEPPEPGQASGASPRSSPPPRSPGTGPTPAAHPAPPSSPEQMAAPGSAHTANLPELEPFGVSVRRDLARFLACDAGLLTVIDDPHGEPLMLGPRSSVIPLAVRRQMAIRDRVCRWPGCASPILEAHHRQHRSRAGGHELENLVGLCRAHHRTVHEHDVRITAHADGALRFHRSDGCEITTGPAGEGAATPPSPADVAPEELFGRHVARGADPVEPARHPRWMGDPLRLVEAVDVLVANRQRHLARIQPT